MDLNDMILLDTCTLLWLTMEPQKLSKSAAEFIRKNAGLLHVSAASSFEIGQKCAAKKLILPCSPPVWLEKACRLHGITPLPINTTQTFIAAALPQHHRDPFDRLLIATAMDQNLTLITPDPMIHLYKKVLLHW